MTNTGTQKAQTILETIVKQTAYFQHQMQQVIQLILGTGTPTDALSLQSASTVRISDIERFNARWAKVIPETPETKAAILKLVFDDYGLDPAQHPHTARLLGVDDERVQHALEAQTGQRFDAALTAAASISIERSALSIRLGRLDLYELQSALEYVFLSSGERLFSEGDAGDSLYIVTSGRLRVMTGEGDHIRVLAERGRFEILGDMALLLDEPRTATVVATRDTELWRISKATFDELVHKYPAMALEITRILARRLAESSKRQTTNRKVNRISTVALVQAGGDSDSVDLAAFAREFANALSGLGSIQHLTSQQIDSKHTAVTAQAAERSLDYIRLTGWLNEQETRHDFVVYQADSRLTEWTKRCIRQADRILLVGRGGSSPTRNDIEEALFTTEQFNPDIRKILVFVHPDRRAFAANTQEWLAQRATPDFFRVNQQEPASLQSLVRHLTGTPLALALSGGSVRGFFHVGILRALEDAGLMVDLIGGTSAGALVGAQVAMGRDSHEIEARIRAAFTDHPRRVIDVTVPYTSLIGGRKINRALRELYGAELCIEDLWCKYYCTTLDLTSSESITFTSGLVWEAVRASISVWPVLPPFLKGGHMLVDGATYNNMPVTEARSLSPAAYLVASDVSDVFYKDDARYNYGDDLTLRKYLNGWLNPFTPRLRTPAGVALGVRSAEANGKNRIAGLLDVIDLHIQPTLQDVGPYDIQKADDLLRKGYQHMADAITGWDYSQQN